MLKNNSQNEKKDYNFSGKNPSTVLTKDELLHFKDGMKLKNESLPADKVDFKEAVDFVIQDLDNLYP